MAELPMAKLLRLTKRLPGLGCGHEFKLMTDDLGPSWYVSIGAGFTPSYSMKEAIV